MSTEPNALTVSITLNACRFCYFLGKDQTMDKLLAVLIVMTLASPASAGELPARCAASYSAQVLADIIWACPDKMSLTPAGVRLGDRLVQLREEDPEECHQIAENTIEAEMGEMGAHVNADKTDMEGLGTWCAYAATAIRNAFPKVDALELH